MFGLGGIERAGQPGLDVAEGAGAGAGVAHDHEGGVLFLPALADIGTAGLLAHGVQAVGAHDSRRRDIAGRDRRLDADPVGLAQARLIRPVRLFRMARRTGLTQHRVDYNGHELSARVLRRIRYVRAWVLRRKAASDATLPPLSRGRKDQILSTRPYASSTASFIISDNVGCGNTVCISSSSVVSRFIATT